MADTSLVFNILAKDKATATLDSIGGKLKGLTKGLAIGAAGAGIAVLGKTLVTGFGEVKDYQGGLSQLQAGLKSTGGVAGISATQMEDLATSIQKYSGQTDDSIVDSEKLLLTFTNVRDAAGANNDIFTQATKASADMAARMGGSASDSAIQLGKALNDPVKGITALTRVGVSFDEGQKKSIAAMVKSGDTIGAQKVILGELNKEFGGSAKAYGQTLPGQIDRAKRAFEDFSQNLVTKLIPVFEAIVRWVSGSLIPWLKRIWTDIQPYLAQFVNYVKTTLWPAIQRLWVQIQPTLRQIGDAFKNLFVSVQSIVQSAVTIITAIWSRFGDQIMSFLRGTISNLLLQLRGAFLVIQGIFQFFADLLSGKWGKLWGDLQKVFEGIWLAIKGMFQQRLNEMQLIVEVVLGSIGALWSALWGGIKTATDTIWSGIKTAVKTPIDTIHGWIDTFVGYFTGLPARLKGVGTGMFDSIKSGFKDVLNTIIGWWDTFADHLHLHIPQVTLIPGSFFNDPFRVGPVDFNFGSGLHVDKLAKGGMSRGPMMAMIGDNPGGKEVALPLGSRMTRDALAGAMKDAGGGGSGDLIIPVSIDGQVVSTVVLKNFRQMASNGTPLFPASAIAG